MVYLGNIIEIFVLTIWQLPYVELGYKFTKPDCLVRKQ